jgi:hypothetical protein
MIKVSGASDDLIEIDGDISEEFNPRERDELLAFSNGVLLRINYSKSGVWRIQPITKTECVEIVPAPEDDENNYSDVATISEPVQWVVLGTERALVSS